VQEAKKLGEAIKPTIGSLAQEKLDRLVVSRLPCGDVSL
jgi:hypothetical protein